MEEVSISSTPGGGTKTSVSVSFGSVSGSWMAGMSAWPKPTISIGPYIRDRKEDCEGKFRRSDPSVTSSSTAVTRTSFHSNQFVLSKETEISVETPSIVREFNLVTFGYAFEEFAVLFQPLGKQLCFRIGGYRLGPNDNCHHSYWFFREPQFVRILVEFSV